ncbi:hypothetical protein VTL71DRAFT_78 [Oculimacula yallundae]|uniref:Uncharacterized protein n=1 Tax=Oculimacula yallundae TaxID=86028 RepID=A0ABR4D1A6_9HELO
MARVGKDRNADYAFANPCNKKYDYYIKFRNTPEKSALLPAAPAALARPAALAALAGPARPARAVAALAATTSSSPANNKQPRGAGGRFAPIKEDDNNDSEVSDPPTFTDKEKE